MRRRSTLLRGQDWSFVILQAQKYSTSGQFVYSTDEAKELVRISRVQHAVPIMFPEWPRKDIDETQRIFDLHVSIAQSEPACVAPIPQAFDLALARDPTLTLHASDGNHSAPAGAFLAALVLVRNDHGPVAARPASVAAISGERIGTTNTARNRSRDRADGAAADVVSGRCVLANARDQIVESRGVDRLLARFCAP